MSRYLLVMPVLFLAGAVAGASLQFNSHFDKQELDGWKGTFAKGQGYMNRGTGLVPQTASKFCALKTGQSNWQKGVIQVKPRTTLTFCYYATEATNITIQCWSKVAKDNLKYSFDVTPMEWMIHSVPFGKGGMGMAPNDAIQEITFLIGRTKQKQLKVLMDNICVGEGIAPHLISAYKKQEKRLAKFTFDLHKHHMIFNKGMVLSLLKGRKPGATAKKIAVVGDGFAAHESFADPLLKSPRGFPKARGYSVVGRPTSAEDGMTMEKLLPRFEKMLETEKPEVIFLCMGFQESIAAANMEKKKSFDIGGIGEAPMEEEEKKAPRGKNHRKAYAVGLQKMIEDSLKAGAIPILFTLPQYSRKKSRVAISNTELLAVNALSVQLSREFQIPVIDASAHLDALVKRRGRLVFKDGANSKAYAEINKLIGKLYKAVEGQVLRPK